MVSGTVSRKAADARQGMAVRANPASNPNAHLVLVGEGVLQAELEAQAKRLKLTRQVHFLGLRADVPDVLGAMDIFVLSSDWEGNPLSILEAMAAGLPIVSTAVGGVPDLFEDGREGVVVAPGNVRAFSNAMSALLENQNLRDSFGRAAGLRAKQRFDVSVMVQSYEDLYEELIARSHSVIAKDLIRASAVSGGKAPVQEIQKI